MRITAISFTPHRKKIKWRDHCMLYVINYWLFIVEQVWACWTGRRTNPVTQWGSLPAIPVPLVGAGALEGSIKRHHLGEKVGYCYSMTAHHDTQNTTGSHAAPKSSTFASLQTASGRLLASPNRTARICEASRSRTWPSHTGKFLHLHFPILHFDLHRPDRPIFSSLHLIFKIAHLPSLTFYLLNLFICR